MLRAIEAEAKRATPPPPAWAEAPLPAATLSEEQASFLPHEAARATREQAPPLPPKATARATSIYSGVSWRKARMKWRAYVAAPPHTATTTPTSTATCAAARHCYLLRPPASDSPFPPPPPLDTWVTAASRSTWATISARRTRPTPWTRSACSEACQRSMPRCCQARLRPSTKLLLRYTRA